MGTICHRYNKLTRRHITILKKTKSWKNRNNWPAQGVLTFLNPNMTSAKASTSYYAFNTGETTRHSWQHSAKSPADRQCLTKPIGYGEPVDHFS
jgi:hypothetical protein